MKEFKPRIESNNSNVDMRMKSVDSVVAFKEIVFTPQICIGLLDKLDR